MDDKTLISILSRLNDLESNTVRLRQGEITGEATIDLGSSGVDLGAAVSGDHTSNRVAAFVSGNNPPVVFPRGAWVNVRDFGAKGDGTTDDGPAIQEAIDAMSAEGGGRVIGGRGDTYLIGDSGTDLGPTAANPVGLLMKDNVTLDLMGATLQGDDVADLFVLVFQGTTNATLRNFILDGNYPTFSSAGHGIWWQEGATDCLIENGEVRNVGSYGIGLQYGDDPLDDAGYIRCTLRNLYIHDTGGDGIDIKDRADASKGVVLDTIRVARHGRRATLSGQAGIDVRGPATLSNIFVEDFGDVASTDGIRFRGEGTGAPSGPGSDESSLTNFRVLGEGVASSIGVAINADIGVQVSNGTIRAVDRGLNIVPHSGESAEQHVITAVRCVACTAFGFRIVGFSGANAQHQLIGCAADNCVFGFRLEDDSSVVIGGVAKNNTTAGVSLPSGTNPTHNLFFGMKFSGNGTDISDSGANDRFIACNTESSATVASAAALTLPAEHDLITVTGSTTVTSITASYAGRRVTLIWGAGATFDVTDGSNLKLSASITTFDADDTLTLACNGTNWYEAGRSTN